MDEIKNKRNYTQPLKTQTSGSTFKNPNGLFAAKLIEEANCKGLVNGDAMVSLKHSNFLINTNKSTAKEIEDLGKDIQEKVVYVGHFTNEKKIEKGEKGDLEKLVSDSVYGYWMRTGNISTNDGTGERYEEAFHQPELKNEKRIVSHAMNDESIDRVLGKDGNEYSISEAYEKKIDWIQIDKGFLSEQEKQYYIKGDVNFDNELNMLDVMQLKHIIKHNILVNGLDLWFSDI